MLNMQVSENQTTVLYDGSCPICSREIEHYKQRDLQGAIKWCDVSSPVFTPPAGHSKEVLMRRFHIMRTDGSIVSGAAAFVYLWEQLPGWRVLAQLSRLPGALAAMEWGYDGFLRIRPKLQKIFS